MTVPTKVQALIAALEEGSTGWRLQAESADLMKRVEKLVERVVERCATTVEALRDSYEAREAHDGGPPLGRMVEEIAASIRGVLR